MRSTEEQSVCDYVGRKKGDRFAFQMTYTIVLPPRVLIETQEPALRLDLPRTPGYTGIILLLEIGVTRRTLQPGVPVSRENIDDRLTDNWLLLRGSRTYPDVLLLVVLQNNPWIRGNNAVSTTLGRSRLRDQANHSTARMRNARGRP